MLRLTIGILASFLLAATPATATIIDLGSVTREYEPAEVVPLRSA